MKSKKTSSYEVTLRRDVVQLALVRVDAMTPQEAIAVAEVAVDGDDEVWRIEEHLGAHRPKVRRGGRMPAGKVLP